MESSHEASHERKNELSDLTSEESIQRQNAEKKKSCQVRYCTGCLYFSSTLKDSIGHPVCVGLNENDSVSEDAVVSLIEKRTALLNKLQRKPLNFKYCCLGYSLYVLSTSNPDSKSPLNSLDSSTKDDKDQPLLDFPACVGVEFLSQNRKMEVQDSNDLQNESKSDDLLEKESSSMHAEEKFFIERQKTSPFPNNEFFTKFERNAKSIANRCVSNVAIVAHGIRNGITHVFSQIRDRSK